MSTRMSSDPIIAPDREDVRTSVSLTYLVSCHPNYAVWHAVAQEILGISQINRVGDAAASLGGIAPCGRLSEIILNRQPANCLCPINVSALSEARFQEESVHEQGAPARFR